MATPFKELAGSPTETYGPDVIRAQRRLLCAWGDRQALVRELLGEGYLPGSAGAAAYPALRDVVARRVRVQPYEGRPDQQGEFTGVASHLNRYSGQYAEVIVDYELATTSAAAPGVSVPDGTYLAYSVQPSTELLAVPTVGMQWDQEGQPLQVDETLPPVRAPVLEHRLDWRRVSDPPWETVRASLGQVNAAPFLGAAAEALLFDGFTADRELSGLDAQGTPRFTWRLTYVFRERAARWATAGYGWNHVLRPNASGGDAWDRPTNDQGQPLYPATTFAGLFVPATAPPAG